MPNYHPQQHPYNYAQYTQPAYTPEFHAGQISPNYQVPFPAHNGQSGAGLATPIPRPKHFSRNTNTTNEQLPYKSALKNGQMTTVIRTENGIPINVQVPRRSSKSKNQREDSRGRNSEQTLQSVRHRNSSNSSRRADVSISRQRTNSKTRFIPDHVFVSFKNDNELHVSNMVEHDSDRLSEAVLQMWPEGHDVMQRRGYKWCVRFHGSPWTASSSEFAGIAARRIIRNLFITLAVLFPLRSMLFSRVPPEVYASQTTDFFILSISSNQRRFTFIEPPESVARNLAVDINPYFPYQVASDRQPEKGLLVLDIREKTLGTPRLDLHIFLAWILHYLGKKGWSLNASIPLPRKRLSFRTGAKKEVWVFRRKGGLGI
ncbi:hypothetical protein BDM02DRAFT_3182151 [Thelephora ganbajun]|uniref:Uncharacterized protein n=1 Tax=Thelephora ganbajun TaxID=370292 RepID=A0ACB6ZY52_THEGA|nr:hypothetical protein BDM02DRAFT_3182151 [Thelephora ganbajun]